MKNCVPERDESLSSDVFDSSGCIGTSGRSTMADLLRLLGAEPIDLRAAESLRVGWAAMAFSMAATAAFASPLLRSKAPFKWRASKFSGSMASTRS